MNWLTDLNTEKMDLASNIESLYQFLKVANLAIALLIMLSLVWFILSYLKKSSKEQVGGKVHTSFLELLWTFFPIAIFVLIFIWGWN